MEKYLEMYNRNQEIVGPETIKYNGEEITVPGMDEEELEEFIKEGEAIGDIEIIIEGDRKIKLLDITDGRRLFKRLDVLNLDKDTNMTAFWYVWRQARMEDRLATLPKAKQAQILAIIES